MKKRPHPRVKIPNSPSAPQIFEQKVRFKRLSQRNVEAQMKIGRDRYRRRQTRTGTTRTVSFTVTQEIDQLIEDLASELHVSRSHVVRQAICVYADQLGALMEE